jgi:hypothetical protein
MRVLTTLLIAASANFMWVGMYVVFLAPLADAAGWMNYEYAKGYFNGLGSLTTAIWAVNRLWPRTVAL